MFHTKIGRRNIVMPGARMVNRVATKFTAPRIPEVPDMISPTIHRFVPICGE